MTLEGQWFGPRPPTTPTIVMLHEGSGSLSTWGDFPQRLAESTGAGVFAYSRAGHGRSMPPVAPRLDAMHHEAEEVLPRLLDAIGFQQGILLGHSDGASIVTIYSGKVADGRLRGIVLIEPHFNVEEKNLNAIRDMVQAFKKPAFRARLARHHSNVDAMFAGWSQRRLDPGFASFDIRQELASIRVQVTMIKCEEDPYSTIAQLNIAKAECRSSLQTIIIPVTGHSPHVSNPVETLQAITSFANDTLWDRG